MHDFDKDLDTSRVEQLANSADRLPPSGYAVIGPRFSLSQPAAQPQNQEGK